MHYVMDLSANFQRKLIEVMIDSQPSKSCLQLLENKP